MQTSQFIVRCAAVIIWLGAMVGPAYSENERDQACAREAELIVLNQFFAGRGIISESQKHFESMLPRDKDFVLVYSSSEFQVHWVIWAWRVQDEVMIGGFFPNRKPQEQWQSRYFVDDEKSVMTARKDIFDSARKLFKDLAGEDFGVLGTSATIGLHVHENGAVEEVCVPDSADDQRITKLREYAVSLTRAIDKE